MSTVVAIYRLLRFKFQQTWSQMLRPAGGPAGRMRRRLFMIAGAVGMAMTALAVPSKVRSGTAAACQIDLFQPELESVCLRLGVKGIETSAERAAWSATTSGNCDALGQFIRRYPHSQHLAEAQARLAARTIEQSDIYVQRDEPRGPLYVREDQKFASLAQAERDAVARAGVSAGETCGPVSDGEQFRPADVQRARDECRRSGGGFVCALGFSAVCHRMVRPLVDVCR